ncbi:DUF1566 domain-containing protein [bacterium]|nr:DUF1566 domain-containing protein [bacterium]
MNRPRTPYRTRQAIRLLASTLLCLSLYATASAQSYPIVDTGQLQTFNNTAPIDTPAADEDFYGQDGQFTGNQPSYLDNGDGTISDLVTGLMWVQDRGEKISWDDAIAGASSCDVGGYDDWRMPTIKELYSLILFTGYMGTSIETSQPFIDTDYFGFEYGDENQGERFIDCQDWTATENLDEVMVGMDGVFGVNFADGRIKCYPKLRPEAGSDNVLYARYVRGNPEYGNNDYTNNGEGTITDAATGLMWSAASSDDGLNWQEALAWVQQMNGEVYLGYNDWRLPNIKELQSIADYSRAPGITNSPAIDPLFEVPEIEDNEYPFYWSNTTHIDGPADIQYRGAAYISFGRALGWMEMPPESGNYQLLDVHGAGAQRSDPKAGNPDDYPYGHGPQGDVIRIYNYVRLVRDADTASSGETEQSSLPDRFQLEPNYPNPFNASTIIAFSLPAASEVTLSVYNSLGQQVAELARGTLSAGRHEVVWNLDPDQRTDASSGIYFYKLSHKGGEIVRKMLLVK